MTRLVKIGLGVVVLAAAIRVVFRGAALPGLVHLAARQPAGEGQAQALPRHDRVEIGMLTQRSPVGRA